jgi:hypothetical protein
MKIRLFAVWCDDNTEFEAGGFVFSAKLPLDRTDGVMAWWRPHPVLYSFNGPKAFYCAEPYEVPSVWLEPEWQECLQLLDKRFIYRPGHSDLRNRVPHDTHHVRLSMKKTKDRISRAVAVVSNNGHGRRELWPEIALRNRLATHKRVDLFGSSNAWGAFRRRFLLSPSYPRNYCGELSGDWAGDALIDKLAGYHAVICLENSCEPYYFTEKFVNAVRAGCVPIYHAHPTVSTGILRNAKWIDPADYGFDATATIEAACNAKIDEFQLVNERWLLSNPVARTESSFVRVQLARLMMRQ